MSGQEHAQAGFIPAIERARIEKLTIYDVSEAELDTLERGSPDSTYLNLAIALLSIALSFTATLCTATVNPFATFVIFVVVTVVGYAVGLVLLVLWCVSRRSMTKCIRTIRDRLPSQSSAPLGPANQ